MTQVLNLKVDVDTERGTRIGVNNLLKLFRELNIKATFLFSLGPDNTGRAIRRIFRKGFFKKVSRTSVISTYGLRTLMNGVLLPGPHIAKRHGDILKKVEDEGHEVGIHSYDHVRWQDHLAKMDEAQVLAEFNKAREAFKQVFGREALTAGTAGWQANAHSLLAYDEAQLLYGSDCRGETPFFPVVNHKVYKTLQLPSTLPTLDELLGLPEYPMKVLTPYLISKLQEKHPNIFTLHAELEGTKHIDWFKSFLIAILEKGVTLQRGDTIARACLAQKENIPPCEFQQGTMPGRSGRLAMQGERK